MKYNNADFTMLLYHGVYNNKPSGIANYSGKHIHIKEFKRQMMIVKNQYSLLSITDLVKLKKEKKSYPKNSVIISFDDGFKNNYKYAYKV